MIITYLHTLMYICWFYRTLFETSEQVAKITITQCLVDRICPIFGGNLLRWAQRAKHQLWICLSRRNW
jgi:hypothetical protein